MANAAERILLGQEKSFRSGDEIAVNCPFHNDRTMSCYANTKKNLFFCHSCGAKGRMAKLIAKLSNISYQQANSLLGDVSGRQQYEDKEAVVRIPYEYSVLPARGYFAGQALRYLLDRRITLEQIQKYSIGFCSSGKYQQRIIVPITYEGKLISFVARDWTNRSERKAINPSGSQAKKALFGWDQCVGIASTLVLTEGWADKLAVDRVLAMDRHFRDWAAVALGGNELSDDKLLMMSGFSRFVVMLDRAAYYEAIAMRDKLTIHRKPINIVEVSGKDPAVTDEREILEKLR